MPKYSYKCSECETLFEIVHPMSEKLSDCLECEISGSLSRIPYSFTTKHKTFSGKLKAGTIVEESINDFRKDLKEQKKELKNTEYKP